MRQTKTFGRWVCLSISYWFSCGCALVARGPVVAQIVPDQTLPTPSVINSVGSRQIILGGTQANSNLFHSFTEFSIPAGGVASFRVGPDVQQVFSRVTGPLSSTIDGRLEVLQLNGTSSAASLFLFNPNGIVFGPNASLNLGGSLIASTANSVTFADGYQFSAVDPQATGALLTVSLPIGLQVGANPAAIRNQSVALNAQRILVGLEVFDNRTLALVGGDVTFDGGFVTTPGGRIELGSVDGPSLVSLTPTSEGWRLGYERVTHFRDLQLRQGSGVLASAAGGGAIQVWGRQLVLSQGSQIVSNTQGAIAGQEITVTTSDSIELIGGFLPEAQGAENLPSGLFAQVTPGATGAGSNITLQTQRLLIQDGAQAATFTFGAGKAGNLSVQAQESVDLVGLAPQLTAEEFPIVSLLASGTGPQSSGNGGDLLIETRRLTIRGGAEAQASTLGNGDAGNLTVRAAESIHLSGEAVTPSERFPSALLAVSGLEGVFTDARGQGGSIEVQTPQLTLEDGAAIAVSSTSTASTAQGAGDINITAETIRLQNRGAIAAETASGNGGNIRLQNPELLVLRRESQISTTAGTAGTAGRGGNIEINQAGIVVAGPLENSDIKANAFLGQGGRVTLTAQSVLGLTERSLEDLQRLLGTRNPLLLDPVNLLSSDITAISQTSPELSGQISLDTPEVDPSRGLAALPANVVDPTNQIAQGCASGTTATARAQNQFIVTGRGGLPLNPGEPLSGQALLVNWARLPSISVHNLHSDAVDLDAHNPSAQGPIVEAQGWAIAPDGTLSLIAQAPTVATSESGIPSASCSRF